MFLAADKVRYQDLNEALRGYLAWDSMVQEKEALNLDPFQAKQAENQKQAAAGAVAARLPEDLSMAPGAREIDRTSACGMARAAAERRCRSTWRVVATSPGYWCRGSFCLRFPGGPSVGYRGMCEAS